jgi:hypothetical protein
VTGEQELRGRDHQPARLRRGRAIGLNPDVRANARRDPDLALLRDSGRLEAALAPDRREASEQAGGVDRDPAPGRLSHDVGHDDR